MTSPRPAWSREYPEQKLLPLLISRKDEDLSIAEIVNLIGFTREKVGDQLKFLLRVKSVSCREATLPGGRKKSWVYKLTPKGLATYGPSASSDAPDVSPLEIEDF